MSILAVGLGGAIGAMARYGLGLIPIKSELPIMTFFINLTGALIIGFFVGLMLTKKDINPNLILFGKVGLCGGFTAFSTFSLEILDLFEDDHPFTAVFYACISVFTCVMGVWVGKKLATG